MDNNGVLAVGDLHGDFPALNQLISQKKPSVVLACGDFGYWPCMDGKDLMQDGSSWSLKLIKPQGAKIYWCDGNHEEHSSLETWQQEGKPHAIQKDVFFMPRGSTLELPDGRNVMFFGGAYSIDKDQRIPGFDWFPEEIPTAGQVKRALEHEGQVDIFISHTCPMGFIIPDDRGKAQDKTRFDLSLLMQHHKPSRWFFGHWHVDAQGTCGTTQWQALAYPHSGRRWWTWLD